MNFLDIPVKPGRSPQRFRIELNGTEYTMFLRWSHVSNCWIMDLSDAGDAVKILGGIPIVTGTDLLGQFEYLGIAGGSKLVALTIAVGHSPDEVPTFANLGTDGHLILVTPNA